MAAIAIFSLLMVIVLLCVFFYYSSKWSAAWYDRRLLEYRKELGTAYSGSENAAHKLGCQLERKDSIMHEQEKMLSEKSKTITEQDREIRLHLLRISEGNKLHDAFVDRTEKDISFVVGLLDEEGRELLKEYELDITYAISSVEIQVMLLKIGDLDRMADILSKFGEITTMSSKTICMNASRHQIVTIASLGGVSYITSISGKLLAGFE